LIIHIPFERRRTQRRVEGNFAAIEIKLRATPADADQAFQSLAIIHDKLAYAITVFLNIDSLETYAHRCPVSIAAQTVCFAVRLNGQDPVVLMARCD
jgi:hypothetical protein